MADSSWEELKDDQGQLRTLRRQYETKNFDESLAFVNEIAKVADEMQHHPAISFGWDYVWVMLYTHSADTVTDKDHELADAIDSII